MREWMARHPFLLLGVVSIVLYATLARSGVMVGLLRVLILPAYLMWMIVTVIQVRLGGATQLPTAVGVLLLLVKFAAALLPYVAADALLDRIRRRRGRSLKPAT